MHRFLKAFPVDGLLTWSFDEDNSFEYLELSEQQDMLRILTLGR